MCASHCSEISVFDKSGSKAFELKFALVIPCIPSLNSNPKCKCSTRLINIYCFNQKNLLKIPYKTLYAFHSFVTKTAGENPIKISNFLKSTSPTLFTVAVCNLPVLRNNHCVLRPFTATRYVSNKIRYILMILDRHHCNAYRRINYLHFSNGSHVY